MDTVLRLQCQLQLLGYSGPLAPPEALLYPGETHYQLLAWLFRSLRGEAADKSGSADEVDTPGLVEAARNLGFSNFEEIESLQGSDSYHRKADFLFLVADLLKASKYTDHDGWRMSGLGHPDLGKQIAELKRCEETLKERKDDLVELKSQGPELVSYDNTAAHAEVEAQLQDFLSAVEHCNQSFPQASTTPLVQSTCANSSNSSAIIQLPGSLMKSERIASLATAKLPQLHGIGPAAKRVHGSYEMLKQLLLGLDTLRIAKGKLPAPPEDKACAGTFFL
eukprot:SM000052S17757  [mRNA]  locus=s52:581256:584397:+ [translate_table: standard]